MAKMGLWAINGIGNGHTTRIKNIYNTLCKDQKYFIRLLVESQIQKKLLENLNGGELLICKRPWKDHNNPEAIKQIYEHFKEIDCLIADLGSVPKRIDVDKVLPRGIKKVSFVEVDDP